MGGAIAQAFSWAADNPAYALGGLIGLAVGVFYGFDGWRGSTTELDLKDSPRMKNLVWILGPAVVAFFGDVKVLDKDASKPKLLLAYFAACVVGAIVVVFFWGAMVAIQRMAALYYKEAYGYGALDAIGDYFFYGYRQYRTEAQAAKQNRSTRFHSQYLEQVAIVVAATGSVTNAARESVVRDILASITAVVKSYHGDENGTMGIHANVMRVVDCTAELRERMVFVGDERRLITKCLKSFAYDDPRMNRPGVVLPLDPASDLGRSLRGAPTAFFHEDIFDVIDDTSKIDFPAGVSDAVRKEVTEYFKDKPFKSFASVRVIGHGGSVGVINVEARVTCVFGADMETKNRIIKYLLPFSSALGIILSDMVQ